jgi:hypothetical protein
LYSIGAFHKEIVDEEWLEQQSNLASCTLNKSQRTVKTCGLKYFSLISEKSIKFAIKDPEDVPL